MNQPVGRGVQRLSEPGVAVAERVHGDAAHEVEISLSVGVDEIDAVAVDESSRARACRCRAATIDALGSMEIVDDELPPKRRRSHQ